MPPTITDVGTERMATAEELLALKKLAEAEAAFAAKAQEAAAEAERVIAESTLAETESLPAMVEEEATKKAKESAKNEDTTTSEAKVLEAITDSEYDGQGSASPSGD